MDVTLFRYVGLCGSARSAVPHRAVTLAIGIARFGWHRVAPGTALSRRRRLLRIETNQPFLRIGKGSAWLAVGRTLPSSCGVAMERATTLPLVNGHVGRTVTYSRYTSSYCFGDSRGSGERDNQRVVLRCDGTYTMHRCERSRAAACACVRAHSSAEGSLPSTRNRGHPETLAAARFQCVRACVAALSRSQTRARACLH